MLKANLARFAALCLAPLATAGGDPINAMCPIGKEPIVASAGTVAYKGNTIGLCCPGCAQQFLAWDEARKDAFVTLASAHREPGHAHAGGAEPGATDTDGSTAAFGVPGPTYPYTLDTCAVSGERLGSMGDPIVLSVGNREARLCCEGCVGDFEANPSKYWAEVDRKIIAQQLMHYPIQTCIVTGEKLGENAVNHVHNNRLVRLTDADAAERFAADPAAHLDALDKAIIKAQLPGYPMDACPVGGPLGSMGEPVNFIYMNRLVRFCCDSCRPRLIAAPGQYMAKLDAAYAEQQRADYQLETCVVSGMPLDSMGGPVELVAGDTLVRFCCDSCFPKFRANPAKFLATLSSD